MGDYIDIRELARRLKISVRTAYSMAQAGQIPSIRVGKQWRFHESDVQNWLARGAALVTESVSEGGKSATDYGSKRQEKETGLDFEDRLWRAADILRGVVDPSDYKPIVLGLLFLRFAPHLATTARRGTGADPAGGDVLQIPAGASWDFISSGDEKQSIRERIQLACERLEQANASLQGALSATLARLEVPEDRLARLIRVLGDVQPDVRIAERQDVLGRVYEYFLRRFAAAEARGGGEYYTPGGVVRLLVELLEPQRGVIYDPCCGSGGMFVQSVAFARERSDSDAGLIAVGQELNPSTWKIARLNLAARGIAHRLGDGPADTLNDDRHPSLQADFVIANPPFNISDWRGGGSSSDPRWRYGLPPDSNANFAWLQHIVSHLKPVGRGAVVLANGSLSSLNPGEAAIRNAMVRDGLVEAVIALPGQLFYTTQIPSCIWLMRGRGSHTGGRDVLFVDARSLGTMESRVHRVLSDADVAKISSAVRGWRISGPSFAGVEGFARSVAIEEIERNSFILNPGRYVGATPESVAAADDPEFVGLLAAAEAKLRLSDSASKELSRVLRGLRGEMS